MTLRSYQEDAVSSAIAAVDLFDETNVVLEAPTGSGKSVLISELCKRLSGNIIVMVNITPLIDQIADHLKEMNIDFSILKSGMEAEYDESHRVQLVMSQTFYARVDSLNMKCDYLIIDERHREYNSQRTNTLREAVKPRAVIGFTATPYNQEGCALSDSFSLPTVSVRELTENGFLTPIRYMVPKWSTNLGLEDIRMSGSDYSGTAIDERFNNQMYMSSVIESMNAVDGKNHKALVFCNSIDQCDTILQYLKNDGYDAYAVHSKNAKDYNEKVLSDFKSAGSKVLVSVSKLNIGFDVKDVTLGVMLRPTKVRSLYIQTVGRLTRTAEGKSHAIFLDLAGTVMEHGFHDEIYSPPEPGDKSGILLAKETAAAEEIKHIVTEEPTEIVRHDVEVFIKELKKKEKNVKSLGIQELSSIFDVSNDIEVIITVAHEINRLKTGASYTASTVAWICSNWNINLTLYPEHRTKWIKALKTRAKNIVKENKKLTSLYYFIDFLVEKKDDNGYY